MTDILLMCILFVLVARWFVDSRPYYGIRKRIIKSREQRRMRKIIKRSV